MKYSIIYHPQHDFAILDPLDPDRGMVRPTVGIKVSDEASRTEFGCWDYLPDPAAPVQVLAKVAEIAAAMAIRLTDYRLTENNPGRRLGEER